MTLIITVLALVALACGHETGRSGPDAPPPTPTKGFPSSMVALGDSITAGYGSCFAPTTCPRNSWATGDGTRVLSHYRKIARVNAAMSGHARNLSEPGATAADLRGQAASAVRSPAEYVTVLVGANDACRGQMTAATRFREDVDAALATLKKGLPKAKVLMISLPDVYRIWEVGHGNALATKVWKSGICPNLLTNPTSTAKADVDRRKGFRDRIAAYNTELRRACAAYGPNCRYTNISAFAYDLELLSAIDFFHPNSAGQQALADETYPSSFGW